MATFNSWREVKKHFKEPDIYKMLDIIFKKKSIKDQAIAFNQDQLQGGQDADGKEIRTIGGNPYRPFTIAVKTAGGNSKAPPDRVTLYETGSFYKTFKVVIVSGGYEIIADFQKGADNILDNFTNEFDFLGLQDSFLTELVFEYLFPELSRMIKEQYKI